MKKIFSLALCAIVFTTNPLFAMDKEKTEDRTVHIPVVNKLKYPVASKYFFDGFNGQSKCVGYLQTEESASYTGTVAVYDRQSESFNKKYARSYQFVYTGNWYGPSIDMIKENNQKTFELYSLSEKDDQVHRFECREIVTTNPAQDEQKSQDNSNS